MSSYLCRSSGGMDLPATSGNSDMIFKGCKFNDSEGNSITGTMINRGDSTNDGGDATIYLNAEHPSIGLTISNTGYFAVNSDGVKRFCTEAVTGAYGYRHNAGYLGLPATLFGNASASDVRSGVTFTSQNGLNLTGTLSNVYNIGYWAISSSNIANTETYSTSVGHTIKAMYTGLIHAWTNYQGNCYWYVSYSGSLVTVRRSGGYPVGGSMGMEFHGMYLY